jgi:hypothetical protein
MITLLVIMWIFAATIGYGVFMTKAIITYKKDTYYAHHVERHTLDQPAVPTRKYQRALVGGWQPKRNMFGHVIESYPTDHTNGGNCPACMARLRGTSAPFGWAEREQVGRDQDIGYIDDRW